MRSPKRGTGSASSSRPIAEVDPETGQLGMFYGLCTAQLSGPPRALRPTSSLGNSPTVTNEAVAGLQGDGGLAPSFSLPSWGEGRSGRQDARRSTVPQSRLSLP